MEFKYRSTTQHSFNDNDPVFIMHTQGSVVEDNLGQEVQCLASAASDHVIKIYQYHDNLESLSYLHSLKGHTASIQDIAFADGHQGVLCSASSDRTIRCWDVRTTKPVCAMGGPKEFFSVCCHENEMVAGTENDLYIWDIRMPDQTRMLIEDAHTDEITKAYFHPVYRNFVLTGGEDGLICRWNLSIEDEYEMMDVCLNPGQPVLDFGFFGEEASHVYCLSLIGLSLWHIEHAKQVSNFQDVREILGAELNGEVSVDYLVNCHYDTTSERLYLISGSHQGGILLSHVNQNDIQPMCELPSATQLDSSAGYVDIASNAMEAPKMLSNGHYEPVRSVFWQDDTIITGGHDARLCVWTPFEPGADDIDSKSSSSSSSSSMRSNASTTSGPLRRHPKFLGVQGHLNLQQPQGYCGQLGAYDDGAIDSKSDVKDDSKADRSPNPISTNENDNDGDLGWNLIPELQQSSTPSPSSPSPSRRVYSSKVQTKGSKHRSNTRRANPY